MSVDWRIVKDGQIVVGSGDHGRKRRFYDRKTRPRDLDAARRWQAAHELFRVIESESSCVQDVTCDSTGGFLLRLHGYNLEVGSYSASPEDDDLWWLLGPENRSFRVGVDDAGWM